MVVVVAGLGCTPIGPGERNAAATLTGSARTEHLEIRYRPNSRSAAAANEVGAAAERELARMTARFGVSNDQRYTLYLFDDAEDLHAVTRTEARAYATGGAVYIVLHDPALVHEMGHVVAFAKLGLGKDEFLLEAMGNAMFGPARIAEMHARSKLWLAQGELPALRDLAGQLDIRTWSQDHPRLGIYDIGGSWLAFLLDTYGPEKLQQYYVGGRTDQAFGAPLAEVEAQWHAWLQRYPWRPEVEAAVKGMLPDANPMTVMEGEGFSWHLVVPSNEKAPGVSFRWFKDGAPWLGGEGELRFQRTMASDAGVYELMVVKPTGERNVGVRLELRVVPPSIFLPADR